MQESFLTWRAMPSHLQSMAHLMSLCSLPPESIFEAKQAKSIS